MTSVDGAHQHPPLRVLLVDDHEVVRAGVRDLLASAGGFEVVGEAGSVEEALGAVADTAPDIAVLDVRLPDGNGIELCRHLRSEHPDLACLMLTSFADQDALTDSVLAGATGFALKEIRGTDLLEALRRVAAGDTLIDAATRQRVAQRLRRHAMTERELDTLTDRERQILDLIGEGLTNRQIGEQIFLAEKTVKNHVSRILHKLGLDRRTQAAAFVVRRHERHRRSYLG